MPKILKSSIAAVLTFVITLALGITIGVTAVDNTSKNMEFNIGITNQPTFKVGVLIGEDYIFNSTQPVSNGQKYIHSFCGNTMKLNESELTFDENGQLTLTFQNFETSIKIHIYINASETPLELGVAGTENAIIDHPITKSVAGNTLINIIWEEAPSLTITFNALKGNGYGYYIVIENKYRDGIFDISDGYANYDSKPTYVYKCYPGDILTITMTSEQDFFSHYRTEVTGWDKDTDLEQINASGPYIETYKITEKEITCDVTISVSPGND